MESKTEIRKIKTGLVMEGGAMRGMFTAGVIDVFLENGIEFDGAVGVSAGAAFGCNYKSKQAGRVIRYNMKYCGDPRFCSIKSLIKTGDMYGADFCYHEIPDKLDIFDYETFINNPMEFYVTVTDVNTGKPIYKKLDKDDGGDYIEWIRASASMPLVSKVVNIGEFKLLDGGMSDSVPLEFFESIGYKKNVVILTRHKGYVKKKSKAFPIFKIVLRKYPKLIESMSVRHDIYNKEIEYIEKRERDGDAFVIRPPEELPINRTEKDPEVLKKVYELGRKTAEDRIEELKRFLER